MRARARRLFGWPTRRVLDPRVAWTVSEIDDRLGSRQHTRPAVHDRLDDLDHLGRQVLQALGHEFVQNGALKLPLARLDPASATFLNWADSPYGYAAQAGLWFNPPVPVEHHAGSVDVLLVNERIVEQPYVFAAVSSVAGPGSRILDVGGSESTVGLSLASLGHDVTIIDPRGSRLEHPRLTVLDATLEELPDDIAPFDVAIALSAIEHFGLEHYGTSTHSDDGDAAALRRIRRLLRPGGALILTAPLGSPSVNAFQRVYDLPGLHDLLRGWHVDDLSVVRMVDRTTWLPAPPDPGDLRRGVALVRARVSDD